MLRSDLRGGSGRMGCGFWHIWVWGDVDRTCVWIGGGVRWGEVCGSDLCVDRRWGEVRWGVWIVGVDRTCVWIKGGVRWGVCLEGVWIEGEVRLGVWIRGVKRSTVEGKLTVGLRLARWSDYREGSEVRWARRDPEWAGSVWVVDGWALSFSRSLSLLRVTRKWFEGKMKV